MVEIGLLWVPFSWLFYASFLANRKVGRLNERRNSGVCLWRGIKSLACLNRGDGQEGRRHDDAGRRGREKGLDSEEEDHLHGSAIRATLGWVLDRYFPPITQEVIPSQQ